VRRPASILIAAAYVAVSLLSLDDMRQFFRWTAPQAAQHGDPYGFARQQRRFAGLAAAVGTADTLGYLSVPLDNPTWDLMYNHAVYALAPRLVAWNPKSPPRYVVGNFPGPVNLEELARTQGLRVIKDFGDGVVLFEREGRR
jgi:hypothetical protein